MVAAVKKSFLNTVEIFGRHPRAYDLFAASPLILWSLVCFVAQWHIITRDIAHINLHDVQWLAVVDLAGRLTRFAFGALLTALVVVRRTPIKKQQGITRRVVAFFGCYVGIAAQSFPVSTTVPLLLYLSSFMVIFGMGFATYSLMWLGRSISIMPESRKLVTGGPYSLVRHPLYVGEQIAVVGIALQATSPFVLAILAMQFCCQLYRMMYEEEILTATFPEYVEYSQNTARLIPWLY